MHQEPETATERSAVVTLELLTRGSLDMDEIVRLTNLTERGARELMYRLSRVLCLVYWDRRWYLYLDPSKLPY